MTWRLEPARRRGVPLLVGMAGPSSSGKTYSALRIATGVQAVAGGEIALLDTENGRALQYAGRFQFQHMPFAAPFNARRYLDALHFLASERTVRTIIMDSMSHEHEGDGGYLAMHEAELDRLAGADLAKRERMTFLAWAKPAAERRALLNGLQQLGRHVIVCLRAKEKIRLEKQGNKTVPVEAGFQPIAGAEFPYDLLAMAVLPPRSNGVPDWSAEAAKLNADMRPLFPPDGEPLDEATGERLARWARGDDVGSKPDRAVAVVDGLLARLGEVADEAALDAILAGEKARAQIDWLRHRRSDEHARLYAGVAARRASFNPPTDEPDSDGHEVAP